VKLDEVFEAEKGPLRRGPLAAAVGIEGDVRRQERAQLIHVAAAGSRVERGGDLRGRAPWASESADGRRGRGSARDWRAGGKSPARDRIGALADSALVSMQVGSVRSVVCGSPAHFAAHGVPKRPEDLTALSAVTFDPLSSPRHWIFRDPKSKRELRAPVRSRLTVNTAEAAIDGAAAGLGVTRVLSYQVAQAVLDGRIEIVLAEYEPAPAPVSLIHGHQGLTPLKVRMALDFAAPRLRARLATPYGGLGSGAAMAIV
jgi:hypothetical protein